jgi:hypothetical protein
VPEERLTKSTEEIMKILFLSIALGLGLALWGTDPQAGVDHLMAAGKIAGEQVYSMLR